jgi:hypothetical protein
MAVLERAATRGEPLRRLRDLAAEGRLEEAYDEVVPLLAELADDPGARPGWARRAGRLLGRADRDAVLARHPGVTPVTVAVTGQSTVADVVEPLTGELARHGLLLHAVVGDHGGWLRDLTDPEDPDGSFRGVAADLTLCLLDDTTVFAEVPAVWGPDDVERAAAEVAERIEAVVRQRAAAGAPPWCSPPCRCPASAPTSSSTTGPGPGWARSGGSSTPGCCGSEPARRAWW